MSAESAIPIADRKSKKHKHGSIEKTKKRKHHEQEDESIVTAEGTPAKKHKKDKKDKKDKKEKKDKTRRHRDSGASDQAVFTDNVATTRDPEPQTRSQPLGLPDSLLSSNSPFMRHTASLYLALSPVAQQFPIEGLCAEHISPLLLTYYPPLKGVVMAYSNPRLSEQPDANAVLAKGKKDIVLSQSIDEYAVTYIWLTAEFTVFRPRKGRVLEGYVSLQNESILGLVCYNYFNAGIEQDRLPKDWKWIAGEEERVHSKKASKRGANGHFVDSRGQMVEGRLVFKVKDFEASPQAESGSGTINVYGTLLPDDQDLKLDEDARKQLEAAKGEKT